MMVWHVHHKDGKYQIWSTVVDAYILREWVSAEVVEQVYVERAIEDAKKVARLNMERAREFYCSAMLPSRCELQNYMKKRFLRYEPQGAAPGDEEGRSLN